MSIRFVRPETAVLTLSGGDTLIVKKRLTAGEQRAQLGRAYTTTPTGLAALNFMETGIALVTAYLVDWSILKDDGETIGVGYGEIPRRVPDPDAVKIRGLSIDELTAVLNNLDPASFTEIKEAIEAHIAAGDAARANEKKTLTGATPAPPTSRSPSVADGASSGSEILTLTTT
jgi:hypothetical protein